MKTNLARTYAAGIILIMGTAAAMAAPPFVLDWFTVDNGGAMRSTGGGFELNGTIGQPDASEPLVGSAFELTGGFWFGLAPDDCNSDGGVNLYDHSDLVSCLSGPHQQPPNQSCLCFDGDGDRDVDVRDIAEFQTLFHGP